MLPVPWDGFAWELLPEVGFLCPRSRKGNTLVYIVKNPHCSPCEQLWLLKWWHRGREARLWVSALPLLTLLKIHLNWAKPPGPEKYQQGLAGV